MNIYAPIPQAATCAPRVSGSAGEVRAQLEDQEKDIAALNTAIAQLESALEGVLGPSPVSAESNCAPDVSTQIGNAILANNRKIFNARRAIEDLIGRLGI